MKKELKKSYCVCLNPKVHDEFVEKFVRGRIRSLSFIINKMMQDKLNKS